MGFQTNFLQGIGFFLSLQMLSSHSQGVKKTSKYSDKQPPNNSNDTAKKKQRLEARNERHRRTTTTTIELIAEKIIGMHTQSHLVYYISVVVYVNDFSIVYWHKITSLRLYITDARILIYLCACTATAIQNMETVMLQFRNEGAKQTISCT